MIDVFGIDLIFIEFNPFLGHLNDYEKSYKKLMFLGSPNDTTSHVCQYLV